MYLGLTFDSNSIYSVSRFEIEKSKLRISHIWKEFGGSFAFRANKVSKKKTENKMKPVIYHIHDKMLVNSIFDNTEGRKIMTPWHFKLSEASSNLGPMRKEPKTWGTLPEFCIQKLICEFLLPYSRYFNPTLE